MWGKWVSNGRFLAKPQQRFKYIHINTHFWLELPRVLSIEAFRVQITSSLHTKIAQNPYTCLQDSCLLPAEDLVHEAMDETM